MHTREESEIISQNQSIYPVPIRRYGVIALIGVGTFLLSLIVLHIMSSGIDWTDGYVSDLANEPHGWVFGFGAFVHGWGNLALAAGLFYAIPPGRLRNWGVLLFGIAAIGVLLTALLPIDPPGVTTPSLSGSLHRPVSSFAFGFEIIAIFIFSINFTFSKDLCWQRLKVTSWLLAVTAALAVVWFVFADQAGTLVGLAERTALGLLMTWEIWIIFQLIRSTAGPSKTN